jgi:Predicted nucleotide-binding protein containing TIR-like domain
MGLVTRLRSREANGWASFGISAGDSPTRRVPPSQTEDRRQSSTSAIQTQGQRNSNVLIEIGAAMALYDRNFILLVEEGTKLPSNLQGLYECGTRARPSTQTRR